MRRYTVKNNSFGDMPIAGYITEIMKKIVDFDGWNVLDFAKELDRTASTLDENGSGELFIVFHSEDFAEMYYELDFSFATDEKEFDDLIENYADKGTLLTTKNSLVLRLFGHDEEFGLEELEMLF